MTTRPIIDISSRSTGLAKSLSNFTERPFVYRGLQCGSMEGFLQSLKFLDFARAEDVARRIGYSAYKIGQTANSWQLNQTLFWQGQEIDRDSGLYQTIIRDAFCNQFHQNPLFQRDLRLSLGSDLDHSIGHDDITRTVLTKSEYLGHLEYLRGLLAT